MTEDFFKPGGPDRLMSRAAAAQYVEERWCIPCKAKTLAKLAVIGGGPVYRLAHQRYPRYAIADLDDWARSRLGPKLRSTSEFADEVDAHNIAAHEQGMLREPTKPPQGV